MQTPLATCGHRARLPLTAMAQQAALQEQVLQFYGRIAVPVVPCGPGCDPRRAYNSAKRMAGARVSNDALAAAIECQWPPPPKAKSC
jgi:hypothetical protein